MIYPQVPFNDNKLYGVIRNSRLAPPCKNRIEYPSGTFKSSFTKSFAFCMTSKKGLLLCDISISERLSLLKLMTASEAFSNTSLGSIHGPALKLCFFIKFELFINK